MRYSSAKIKIASLLVLANAALVFQSANAQTQTGTVDTWALSGSGTWSSTTGANWSNGVPNSSSDVTFGASTSNEVITLPSGGVALGLFFDNVSTPSFSTQLSGTVQVGADGIYIYSGSTFGAPAISDVELTASQTWTNQSSASFEVFNVTPDSAVTTPVTLTFAGSGSGGFDLHSGGGIEDNSATGKTSVVIDMTGTGGLTFEASGNASTYSGGTTVQAGAVLAKSANPFGSGALTLGDSATDATAVRVTFDNSNSYANNITVQSGTTGLITLSSNGGTTTFSGTVSLGNTLTSTGSGTSGAGTNVFTNTISGGGIMSETAGGLTLSGNNTYSGGTLLSNGTLNINASGTSSTNSAIGTGALTISGGTINNTSGSAVTLGTNNALTLNGTLTFTGTSNLNFGVGAVSLGTTAGTSRTITVNGGVLTIGGVISNGTTATALTKGGVGTLVLSGANLYTGATAVTAGILNIQNSTALGTDVTGNSISSGATLQLQSASGISVGNQAFTINGVGATAAGGTGALENVSGANSFGGLLTLAGATTIMSDAGSLALTNGGTITGATFGLTLGGAGNGSVAAVIGTTTGGVTKTGSGTWTLSGASTYTGGTTIENGTLVAGISSTGSITNGAFGTGTVTLGDANTHTGNFSPTVLIGASGVTIANPITVSTQTTTGAYTIGGSNTTGTATYTGAITLNNNVTLQAATGGTVDFKGTWNNSGNNGFTIGSTGNTGTVEVDSAVTTNGGISVVDGALLMGNTFNVTGGSFGIGTAGTLSSNSAGDVTGNVTLTGSGIINLNAASNISGTLGVTGGNWNGAGSVTGLVTSSSGDFNIGTGANLTANGGVSVTGGTISSTDSTGTITGNVSYGSSAASTFGGVIAGSGKALSVSAGSLTVTNSNTYTGGTTITGGTLYVNGVSGTGSGAVSVTGGTLAGNGTIKPTGGAGVTIGSGATLASGANQSAFAVVNGGNGAVNGTGTGGGLTIDNTEASSSVLNIQGGATLTFALGSTTAYNGGSGALNFANPNTDSTYLSLTGSTVDQIFANTSTSDVIKLVDLTNGANLGSNALTLRSQNPYLLINSGLSTDADFANLVTTGGTGANGYVLGVSNGSGGYTAFTLGAYDINGNLISSGTNLEGLQLYLYNGELEVVPEPGTWALMIGGLALLVVIQHRKNNKLG